MASPGDTPEESPGDTAAEKLARWEKTGPCPPYLEPDDDMEEPTEEELEQFIFDGVCDATDGCRVEPDGYCEHGHVSWCLYLGLI